MFEAERHEQGQGPVIGDGICAAVLFNYEATELNELTLHEGEIVQNIQVLEERWLIGVTQNGRGIFPANYVQFVESTPLSEFQAAPAAPTYQEFVEFLAGSIGADEAKSGIGEEESEGLTAVALYDYDATEDNDLSFKAGDVIWGIEVGSDLWCRGKVGQGAEQIGPGVFPSNFVQFIESTPLSESQAAPAAPSYQESEGLTAVALYDYNATEDNDLSFKAGDVIWGIEVGSDLWCSGKIGQGAEQIGPGVFPLNFVQFVESTPLSESQAAPAAPSYQESEGLTAVALHDYNATEDNDLSFKAGDVIWGIEVGSDLWCSGKIGQGAEQIGPGVFPSNFVQFIESTPFSESQAAPAAPTYPEGLTAVALYDYDATEDNDLSFKAGDVIWGIEVGSDLWCSGKVGQGTEQIGPGLFPSNYVEFIPPESVLSQAAATPTYEFEGFTAVAILDFHATGDGELSFKEGDLIWGIEDASLEWWSGKVGQGTEDMRSGLFPANHVELVESISTSESALPRAAPLGGDKAQPEVGEDRPEEFGAGEEELEGPTAVAVYNYDATEDNEISFREGDVIWGIEVVSYEWWSGKVGQDTEATDPGLFPADYVVWIRGGVKEVLW